VDSSSDQIAGNAFVSAVVKTFEIEDQMLELRAQLQQADANAARANEAALRELGFTETSPPDQVFDAQERFLKRAIEQAHLSEGSPIPQAALNQIRNARQQYEEVLIAEGERLGQLRGPAL